MRRLLLLLLLTTPVWAASTPYLGLPLSNESAYNAAMSKIDDCLAGATIRTTAQHACGSSGTVTPGGSANDLQINSGTSLTGFGGVSCGSTGFVKALGTDGAATCSTTLPSLTLSDRNDSAANLLQLFGNASTTTPAVDCATNGAAKTLTLLNSNKTDTDSARNWQFCDGTSSGPILPVANDTLVGKATTDTLTNKTLDAEGTGNVLSLPEKVWLPAAGCNNATAATFFDLPTSTPASPTCVTGTNIQKGVLAYADTSGGFSAQTTLALPVDWTTTGGVDIVLYWTTTATTGNAKWSVSTACTDVAATTTDDPTFNAANTGTTAAPGVASRVQTTAISALTLTGCTTATKMLLHLKIFRDGNDAADTIAATANLIGAELTYRRAI